MAKAQERRGSGSWESLEKRGAPEALVGLVMVRATALHKHCGGQGGLNLGSCPPSPYMHPGPSHPPTPAHCHLPDTSFLWPWPLSSTFGVGPRIPMRAGPVFAIHHLNSNRKPFQTTLQTRLYKGKMRMCSTDVCSDVNLPQAL